MFDPVERTYRDYIWDEYIPTNTVYVVRAFNTQFDPEFTGTGTARRLRAARIRLQWPHQSNTPGEFRRHAAHELGHSFGLNDVTFGASRSGLSIMGESFDVSDCDDEAVRKVYCPMPYANANS